MNREDALSFLQAHQPLPNDAALATHPHGQEWLAVFDEARKYFKAHPDPDGLPLLLGACGDKDGFGVYRLLDDAFTPHPADVVVPHLIAALHSPHLGVRFHAAELSAGFPDDQLIPHLVTVYLDGDEDEQFAALLALTRNSSSAAMAVLRELRPTVTDDEQVALLNDYFTEKA